MPPQDDDFKQRKRDETTKFYEGWIRSLAESTQDGSITPVASGGPRITKYTAPDATEPSFYVDAQGRSWPEGTPPADLEPMTFEDALTAAVDADIAAHADDEPSVPEVQGLFNFRALDFYELVEEQWFAKMQGELRIGKDFSDDADLELRRFVSMLADRARENYLLVYTGGGQLDGHGDEIPVGAMTIEEYARRVAAALVVLFYG